MMMISPIQKSVLPLLRLTFDQSNYNCHKRVFSLKSANNKCSTKWCSSAADLECHQHSNNRHANKINKKGKNNLHYDSSWRGDGGEVIRVVKSGNCKSATMKSVERRGLCDQCERLIDWAGQCSERREKDELNCAGREVQVQGVRVRDGWFGNGSVLSQGDQVILVNTYFVSWQQLFNTSFFFLNTFFVGVDLPCAVRSPADQPF